jgi:hypothetical protein
MPEPYSLQADVQGMIRSGHGNERYRFFGLGGIGGQKEQEEDPFSSD